MLMISTRPSEIGEPVAGAGEIMPLRRIITLSCLLVLGISTAGCTPPTPPAEPKTINPEQIVETSSNSAPTDPDELSINNCGSTVPFTGKHSVSRELTYTTSWEYNGQVGIGGEVAVSPLVKVNVDVNVSAKYGKSA